MKKKLLAGILCLLMVFTMIPGVFAAPAETAENAHSTIFPTDSIIEDCPKCKFESAFFHIVNGNVIFFCPSCKESGPVFTNPKPCFCGTDCTCMLLCSCGHFNMCGDLCRICYTYNVCETNCFDCWFEHGVAPKKCICGADCECIVVCDCGRATYCGKACPGCGKTPCCDTDCTSCEAPECECGCGSNCNAPVKCDTCGRYVFCGDICGTCRNYAYCGEDCKYCGEYPDYDHDDYFYPCVCGRNCLCPVKCSTCGTLGFCGDFCGTCDKYLSCGIFCKNCMYWGGTAYTCLCGDSCLCLVPCTTCLKPEAGFCGEKCGTCGNTLKCLANCKTCSYVAPTINKVTVTQSFGGTYNITNGLYGYKNETKTLTVHAYPGFTVSDVTINGVSHGDTTEFELKMDTNYQVSITFARLGFVRQYTVQTTTVGGGKILVTKNNTALTETASITAAHKDTLYCTFVPAENYFIKDVKINGESIGAVSLYNITEITKDTSIEVTFGWKNPYTDIAEEHLAAVEYATEKKLMTSFYTYRLKHLFKGEKNVSLFNFITTVAEAADAKNMLNTQNERFNWAVSKGLIKEDANTAANVNVQTACDILAKLLETVEKTHNITINGDNSENTAKDTCLALKLTTEEAYTGNKNLTRYDFAELLLSLSKVTYTKAQ